MNNAVTVTPMEIFEENPGRYEGANQFSKFSRLDSVVGNLAGYPVQCRLLIFHVPLERTYDWDACQSSLREFERGLMASANEERRSHYSQLVLGHGDTVASDVPTDQSPSLVKCFRQQFTIKVLGFSLIGFLLISHRSMGEGVDAGIERFEQSLLEEINERRKDYYRGLVSGFSDSVLPVPLVRVGEVKIFFCSTDEVAEVFEQPEMLTDWPVPLPSVSAVAQPSFVLRPIPPLVPSVSAGSWLEVGHFRSGMSVAGGGRPSEIFQEHGSQHAAGVNRRIKFFQLDSVIGGEADLPVQCRLLISHPPVRKVENCPVEGAENRLSESELNLQRFEHDLVALANEARCSYYRRLALGRGGTASSNVPTDSGQSSSLVSSVKCFQQQFTIKVLGFSLKGALLISHRSMGEADLDVEQFEQSLLQKINERRSDYCRGLVSGFSRSILSIPPVVELGEVKSFFCDTRAVAQVFEQLETPDGRPAFGSSSVSAVARSPVVLRPAFPVSGVSAGSAGAGVGYPRGGAPVAGGYQPVLSLSLARSSVQPGCANSSVSTVVPPSCQIFSRATGIRPGVFTRDEVEARQAATDLLCLNSVAQTTRVAQPSALLLVPNFSTSNAGALAALGEKRPQDGEGGQSTRRPRQDGKKTPTAESSVPFAAVQNQSPIAANQTNSGSQGAVDEAEISDRAATP